MTPEQFAYWLQGFVELGDQRPTEAQWNSIKEHLQTVFNKVTSPVNASHIGTLKYRKEDIIGSSQISNLSC